MVGLWLVRERFLNVSWRVIIIVTTIFVNVIDIPITLLTVYDVVRNQANLLHCTQPKSPRHHYSWRFSKCQYFYLDDNLITAIPSAAAFIVGTYVIVEVAQPGTEAVTYGLLSTASNLGGPVASGLSNWLFSQWQPSLSDANNFVKDEHSFRDKVRLSWC